MSLNHRTNQRYRGVAAWQRQESRVVGRAWTRIFGRAATWRRIASFVIVFSLYVFLLAPLVVVAGASLDRGFETAGRPYLNFPPYDYSLYWYFNISPALYKALALSVGLGLFVAALATVIGVFAALGLVRSNFRGKSVVATIFRAPLQIPFVVIGVAFLQTYFLLFDLVGLQLAATFIGFALAHVFVAVPYVIGSVVAVLERFNPRMEEAALILGASRWTTFRRVTLPIIMPGVYTGALFAFLVSFGDVQIAIFLGGAKFTTLPVEIFYSMAFSFDPGMLAMSTIIIFASIILLLVVQRLVGLDTLLRTGRG